MFPFLLWLLGNSPAAVTFFFTVVVFLGFFLSPDFQFLFALFCVTVNSVASIPCRNKIIKCRIINGSEVPPVSIRAESPSVRAVAGPAGHCRWPPGGTRASPRAVLSQVIWPESGFV